jgi:hypothetical protein
LRSNLRLKSNVYVRNTSLELRDDEAFVHQVRGESAVRRLLGMYGIPPERRSHSDSEVIGLLTRGRLTQRQLNTIKWGLPCVRCGCIPIGVTFGDVVESRCDEPGCVQRTMPVRPILIPESVVRDHAPFSSWGQILSDAIQSCGGVPPAPSCDQPTLRIAVRIAPTAEWIYTDSELSAFIIYGLKNQRLNHARD